MQHSTRAEHKIWNKGNSSILKRLAHRWMCQLIVGGSRDYSRPNASHYFMCQHSAERTGSKHIYWLRKDLRGIHGQDGERLFGSLNRLPVAVGNNERATTRVQQSAKLKANMTYSLDGDGEAREVFVPRCVTHGRAHAMQDTKRSMGRGVSASATSRLLPEDIVRVLCEYFNGIDSDSYILRRPILTPQTLNASGKGGEALVSSPIMRICNDDRLAPSERQVRQCILDSHCAR